jgi:hypothetical protein
MELAHRSFFLNHLRAGRRVSNTLLAFARVALICGLILALKNLAPQSFTGTNSPDGMSFVLATLLAIHFG